MRLALIALVLLPFGRAALRHVRSTQTYDRTTRARRDVTVARIQQALDGRRKTVTLCFPAMRFFLDTELVRPHSAGAMGAVGPEAGSERKLNLCRGADSIVVGRSLEKWLEHPIRPEVEELGFRVGGTIDDRYVVLIR